MDQGDFNWISPQFLALASPQHKPIAPVPPTSPEYAMLPKDIPSVKASTTLPGPFKNVLTHFTRRNVGLVVRLNSELYSPSYFTALGINHLDMIFDDGTCPPLSMVKKFIKIAHEMINVQHRGIAVHCKAGLGRTGCLIGAYLIYRHGFTANEVIAFMRFMRPGMVVGPQQHWLHLNQGTFREWWWEDTIKAKLAQVLPSTPTKTLRHRHETVSNGQAATPPNASAKRSALGEIDSNEANGTVNAMDENLPAPTPGQPRKTSRMDSRHHPYVRAMSGNIYADKQAEAPQNETVEMQSHRQSHGPNNGETADEWELRMLSRRTGSRSPRSGEKRRAISYTTTTTSTTKYSTADNDSFTDVTSDVENWTTHPEEAPMVPNKPKTPTVSKSGNGSGTLGVGKIRGSPMRRSAESREVKNGVRKPSGRVGSASGASRSRS